LDAHLVVGANSANTAAPVIAALFAIALGGATAAQAFALDAVFVTTAFTAASAAAIVTALLVAAAWGAGIFNALSRLADRFAKAVATTSAAAIVTTLLTVATGIAGTLVGGRPDSEDKIASDADGLGEYPQAGAAFTAPGKNMHHVGAGSSCLVIECAHLLAAAHAEHGGLCTLEGAPFSLKVSGLSSKPDYHREIAGIKHRWMAVRIALIKLKLHPRIASKRHAVLT